MREITAREARANLSHLLDDVQKGANIFILRRGKKVAEMVPVKKQKRPRFPDLTSFRASIRLRGSPMSKTVINLRKKERY